jgi:hypothetical protein
MFHVEHRDDPIGCAGDRNYLKWLGNFSDIIRAHQERGVGSKIQRYELSRIYCSRHDPIEFLANILRPSREDIDVGESAGNLSQKHCFALMGLD